MNPFPAEDAAVIPTAKGLPGAASWEEAPL